MKRATNSKRIPANSASKKLPSRVSKAEWDFYQLPDGEVHLAFFYEYARSSKTVRDLVDRFRHEVNLSRRPSQPILEHGLLPILIWLMRITDFPNKPWKKLKRETRQSADLGNPSSFSLWAPQPIDFLVGLDVFDGSVPKDKTKMTLGRAGVEYRFTGTKIKTAPHESIFVLRVNWKASDLAITQALNHRLDFERPAEFARLAKPVSGKQSSFDEMKFPFRKANALWWLGVFRRRNAVETWREYLELWNATALQKINSGVVKSRDISTLARPCEEDYRKAKLILDWFENGTALKKQDFK
jgi:hypothetical protein